jgi:dihydrofolate reductase
MSTTPKLVVAMHVTLDGYVAGPNGEINWISLGDELFAYVGELTRQADTALYGRKTFEMMDAYWPSAGEKPNATKHDREHSAWYKAVDKYVLSNSRLGKDFDRTKFFAGDLKREVAQMKRRSRSSILIFGSPSAVQALLREKLLDELHLFVNPVLLGHGVPLFDEMAEAITLRLEDTRVFASTGVVCLHYGR